MKKNKNRTFIKICMVIIMPFLLLGCGGSSSEEEPPPPTINDGRPEPTNPNNGNTTTSNGVGEMYFTKQTGCSPNENISVFVDDRFAGFAFSRPGNQSFNVKIGDHVVRGENSSGFVWSPRTFFVGDRGLSIEFQCTNNGVTDLSNG